MTTFTIPPVRDVRNETDRRDAGTAEIAVAPMPSGAVAPSALPAHDPPTPVEEQAKPDSELPPAAGPTAWLVALPQRPEKLPTTLAEVDEHLSLLEAARQTQLDVLPQMPRDVVAAAHRGTVARILGQVQAARRRLSDGRYGSCEYCETVIDLERLELRPWLTTCIGCAPRDRP